MLEDKWISNRHRKRKPKLGLFWCYCDLSKINSGGAKCKVCHKRQKNANSRDRKW